MKQSSHPIRVHHVTVTILLEFRVWVCPQPCRIVVRQIETRIMNILNVETTKNDNRQESLRPQIYKLESNFQDIGRLKYDFNPGWVYLHQNIAKFAGILVKIHFFQFWDYGFMFSIWTSYFSTHYFLICVYKMDNIIITLIEIKLTRGRISRNTWSYSPCKCNLFARRDVQPRGWEKHRIRRRNERLGCKVPPESWNGTNESNLYIRYYGGFPNRDNTFNMMPFKELKF